MVKMIVKARLRSKLNWSEPMKIRSLLAGQISTCFLTLTLVTLFVSPAASDPCGMVPPIYTGPGSPITRIGLQQTYVFFDDGVESFVIRPGFQGKVDNFGMLIPFPTPPALRKVPDNIFEQIANAVDPPEVVVDLLPRPEMMMNFAQGGGGGFGGGGGMRLKKREVRVLKEEAVGMYEVAVLEAGSPEALSKWMDKHKYQYPKGMDKVVGDYVNERWCFVAVKTKVGAKADAEPKPGQRNAQPRMPEGSVFDGTVQGLGFRFKTKELVVPMRLSAFNEGDLRNVVYLLTKGGKSIRSIPEEYVQRQIPGRDLVDNITKPLPLRILGGQLKDIPKKRMIQINIDRDPTKANGIAKQLFAADLLAVGIEGYSHRFEETEKEILRIGEHFGLRGKEIDELMQTESGEQAEKLVASALPKLKKMTLTVVDGDFPRQVIANQNLTFKDFQMARRKNRIENYDTKIHGPAPKKNGVLISSYERDQPAHLDAIPAEGQKTLLVRSRSSAPFSIPAKIAFSLIGLVALVFVVGRGNRS